MQQDGTCEAEPGGGGLYFEWATVELEVDSVALEGTLDSFSLPDVLRLLAGTGKSGCLQVHGDRGEGNVWVEAGEIVAARAERALGDAPVEEVVFELLRYGEGSFRFAPDEKAPEVGGPYEVDQTLDQASELLEEWRELELVVPSLEHRVTIAPELTVDQVTVDAERWKTLVAMAKSPSVGELGMSLSQGELAVSRTVSDLVELGVAVVEVPGGLPSQESAPREEPATSTRATGATRRPRPERGSTNGDNSRRPAKSNGQRDRRELRDRQDRDSRVSAPARARTSDEGADGDGDSQGEPSAPVNGKLPRRSRTTGQRSGGAGAGAGQGRHIGGNGSDLPSGGRAAPGDSPPAMANPSTSPFTDGSILPTQSLPQQGPTPQPRSQQAVPQPTTSSGGLAGLPPFDNSEPPSGFSGGSALDAGMLGPSPLPADTGQVPVVAASSLPPDLSWAADDDEAPLGGPGGVLGSGGSSPFEGAGIPSSPPLGTPPVVPPAPPSASQQLANTGRSPLAVPGPMDGHGPAGSPLPGPAPSAGPMLMGDGGETAPHVAVMSPDARHAVESIIGPSGGGSGVVPAAGATPEESNQRGALLGFLASVRPH